MNLLDIQVPPFARIVYASQKAKEVWESKVQRAARAYYTLERETVKHGLRACYTEHIQPHEFQDKIQELAKNGLTFVPIRAVGSYNGFSHYHPPVVDGKPWSWYGAVAKNASDAYAFAYASASTPESKGKEIDHLSIGKLLGYPVCCQEFFNTVWRSGFYDPVWQEAYNCSPKNVKKSSEHLIRLKSTIPYETSVMLRYIGIRILPHIPCAHDCYHSAKMARDWVQLGQDIGVEGLEDLLEIMQMPVEWDCLKGIAYVTTPVFKVETNSVPCYPNYTVQKEGTFYPDNAPKGNKFPWTEAWKFKGL